ncbi:hypothetical protein GCM10023333_28700 [Ferrimonas pelagia]|uniref:Uncharacterized protein n=2 Tax=Ferrimonas pelagia TaxID=1177826 RepID=A0ABP9F6G8_9GAMM
MIKREENQLNELLAQHPSIESYRLNLTTQSILITYDAEILPFELVEQLFCDDFDTVLNTGQSLLQRSLAAQ